MFNPNTRYGVPLAITFTQNLMACMQQQLKDLGYRAPGHAGAVDNDAEEEELLQAKA